MFGAMGRTPAINGGMRGSRGDDDDDDDDDDGGASFKRDAISLDQVGFVTLSHKQSESAKSHRADAPLRRLDVSQPNRSSELVDSVDLPIQLATRNTPDRPPLPAKSSPDTSHTSTTIHPAQDVTRN
jgi:hypothetical protein